MPIKKFNNWENYN